jgi:histone-lysine N-methyltransferase SETMAR
MIADEVNTNRETIRLILTEELGMRKICAKMVPRNIIEQQRDTLLSVCADLLEQVKADSELMDQVVTGDESWFFQYDPQTKHQSLEWHSKGSPRPKNARMSLSKVKCMLVCFLDSMGIVHNECNPAGQTVNQYYYTEILERLRKRVMRVCPIIQKTGSFIINAPAHATLSVAQFLISKSIMVMLQPSFSPDLAPCDFFLFQKVKSAVKGHHFESAEGIQRAVMQALNDTPQAAFQECYKQWQHRWKRCVQAQGMYFEGDHIVVDE